MALGGSVGSASVRAGGAHVDIRTDKRQFKKDLQQMKSDLKDFGREIAKIGLVLTGTALFISKSFLDFAKLAALQRSSTIRLEAVLLSTGQAAGISAKELEKMALALEDLTAIGGEVITDAQAILLSFTKIGKEVFPEALIATANIAALFKGDMSAAAIQLGKALNDPIKGVNALTRSGVSFSAGMQKVIVSLVESNKLFEAQSIILKEIKEQGFGGQAAAAGRGFIGQLEQMTRRLDEIKEAIGEAVIPEILRFAKAIERWAIQATKWVEQNEEVIVSLARLSAQVALIGTLMVAATGAVFLFGNAWALVAGAAALALATILDTTGQIDTGFENLQSKFTVFGNTLDQWAQKIALTLLAVWQGLILGVNKILRNFVRSAGFVQAKLSELAVQLKIITEAQRQGIGEKTIKGVEAFTRRVNEAQKALNATTDALADFNAESDKTNEQNKTNPLSEVFLDAKKKLKEFLAEFNKPIRLSNFGGGVSLGGGADTTVAGVPSGAGVTGFFGSRSALEQVGASQGADGVQRSQLNVQRAMLDGINQVVSNGQKMLLDRAARYAR